MANVESSSLSAIFLEILKIRRNRFLNLNIAFTKYLRWIILLNPSLRSIRVFLLFFQIRNIYIYIWYTSRIIIKSFFFFFFFFKIKIIHEKNWIFNVLNLISLFRKNYHLRWIILFNSLYVFSFFFFIFGN